MYKIVGDIEPRSFWLVTTPSAAQLEMPYVCTKAGTLYGKRKFLTERDGKESYLLFYTFAGAGFVRQNNRTVTIRHGQMLLMDCTAPQSYGTSPDADHWYHLWAHVEGSGVEATARVAAPAGLGTSERGHMAQLACRPMSTMPDLTAQIKSIADARPVVHATHRRGGIDAQ